MRELAGDAVPAVEVLAVDHAEDGVLSRAHLLRLHARPGITVLLDLRRSRLEDPTALVREFEGVTAGNEQRLALLGRADGFATAGPAGLAEALEGIVGGLDFRLSLPCRVEYLAEVRGFLARRVARVYGEVCAFRVEVVLDELCLNAIEHSPSRESRFGIEAGTRGSVLHLRVSNDHSRGRDDSGIMRRRLREFDPSGGYLGERGRGLFLVAQLADGLNIEADEGRVHVHVWKDLAGPATA